MKPNQPTARTEMERDQDERRARMAAMITQLEAFADRAAEHVALMRQAVEESQGWSESADREWARAALADALRNEAAAKRDVEHGRAILSEIYGTGQESDRET